ncbi:MAG: hypothetical protein WCR19_04555 [Acholeplasmataceae bacterium]
MSSLKINEFAKAVHEVAIDHGWYDEARSFGDVCALIHSEVSEAFQSYRNNEPPLFKRDGKLEGVLAELADVVIRILDYSAAEGYDLESVIELKHEHNINRPFKYGGKKL